MVEVFFCRKEVQLFAADSGDDGLCDDGNEEDTQPVEDVQSQHDGTPSALSVYDNDTSFKTASNNRPLVEITTRAKNSSTLSKNVMLSWVSGGGDNSIYKIENSHILIKER